MTRDQIMAVPCSACGARPGHACRVYTYRSMGQLTKPHASRRSDAVEALVRAAHVEKGTE